MQLFERAINHRRALTLTIVTVQLGRFDALQTAILQLAQKMSPTGLLERKLPGGIRTH
jgi:hypothetical protein